MRQENVERISLDQVSRPVHSGTGIEDNAHLGQHQTSSLPTVVGMIASRTKKM